MTDKLPDWKEIAVQAYEKKINRQAMEERLKREELGALVLQRVFSLLGFRGKQIEDRVILDGVMFKAMDRAAVRIGIAVKCEACSEEHLVPVVTIEDVGAYLSAPNLALLQVCPNG